MSVPLAVLGPMRTGTSLVAGLLQALGCAFGPEDRLLAANRANPTGFREHRGIIALNDAILAAFGGTWDRPPELPAGWPDDPRLDDLHVRAAALVDEDLASHALWAFKDPRTSLTLPFWLHHADLSCVVCLRHPAASARSLAALPWAQRRGLTTDDAEALWLRYTGDAWRHALGRRHVVVHYDRAVVDVAGQLHRLAAIAGVGEPSRAALEAARTLVQPALRHHEEGSRAPEDDTQAARLYASLSAAS